MNTRTPIADIDHKLDIIDHVNQDHTEELLAIAQHHRPQDELQSARVDEIFEDGIELTLDSSSESPETLFVPFEIDGSLEDKILYLAYAAIASQRHDLGGSIKRFFEVTDKQAITPNMIRLSIRSTAPLPDYYPGYAYAFFLKRLNKRPQQEIAATRKNGWEKKLFDRGFIWLMKHLSSKNRQKLLISANKDIRLYTLRKSWRSADSTFSDRGYIDIFKHGDTPGSLWAEDLRVGDIIQSRSETPDKHPHLAKGKALLIADETAFPALAGILEHWQNPVAPEIILISADNAEQAYFGDALLPKEASVSRITCTAEAQSEHVLAILKQTETVDVAWAALESEAAKAVRHYLRNERHLRGRDNHTKAYWSLKNKRGD